MKCPKCHGLTLVRNNTGHESQFDAATGVTTRVRVCKSEKCGHVFKTHERLDVDDGELRRRAFLYDMSEARLKKAREDVDRFMAVVAQHVETLKLP